MGLGGSLACRLEALCLTPVLSHRWIPVPHFLNPPPSPDFPPHLVVNLSLVLRNVSEQPHTPLPNSTLSRKLLKGVTGLSSQTLGSREAP